MHQSLFGIKADLVRSEKKNEKKTSMIDESAIEDSSVAESIAISKIHSERQKHALHCIYTRIVARIQSTATLCACERAVHFLQQVRGLDPRVRLGHLEAFTIALCDNARGGIIVRPKVKTERQQYVLGLGSSTQLSGQKGRMALATRCKKYERNCTIASNTSGTTAAALYTV